MCPDRQMISLFFDGELPSPWKEKMEAHLTSCAKCRAILARYTSLEEKTPIQIETIDSAQERVWKKLFSPELIIPKDKLIPTPRLARNVWSRSVTMPLPAAAAVLVIIVFFALAGIRASSVSQPHNPAAIANIGLDDEGIVPISDMNGVMGYLSNYNNEDFMIIRLPESKNFSRSGEPTLINAADYSKRRDFR